MSNSSISLVLILFLAGLCAAQGRESGAAAGIGRAYEAAGRSTAARDLQKKLGGTLIRAATREKAATRQVAAGGKRKAAGSSVSPSVVPAGRIDDTAAYFRPDPSLDSMAAIAGELGKNATEREQLRRLFVATKEAFEKEVAAKGRSNNLPAAFTFFIASTVTVYRDEPEPSDKAIDNLWDGMSGALTEMPELSSLTNAEKQRLYDMLVAFSGFVLAGYVESKTSGDADSLMIFRTLSGELIRTVLKTDPATLRFSRGGLDIVN